MNNGFLTYDKVLKLINSNNKKKNLLIGNGFSMAYNKDRFSFTSLLQSAVKKGIIKKDSKIYQIFQQNKTSDFEEVIKILEHTSKIVKIYSQIHEQLCENLLKDSKTLKKHLIATITNNHPEKSTDIPSKQFDLTADFIKDYDVIYSLNYDLLLYWVTQSLRERIEREKPSSLQAFTDGFSKNNNRLEFNNTINNDSTCLYLHGALHIFDDGNKIIKKTCSGNKLCLTKQITTELDNNRYPIFVSEGTSEQKKTKILHNAYLNHCYKSLSSIGGGDLVVFGTMLKSNDEHIQEAILKSKVKNIYFGVSSLDKGKYELSGFIEKAKEKKKEVKFYNYKDVKIWNQTMQGAKQ